MQCILQEEERDRGDCGWGLVINKQRSRDDPSRYTLPLIPQFKIHNKNAVSKNAEWSPFKL